MIAAAEAVAGLASSARLSCDGCCRQEADLRLHHQVSTHSTHETCSHTDREVRL